jgi:hypothetical protein
MRSSAPAGDRCSKDQGKKMLLPPPLRRIAFTVALTAALFTFDLRRADASYVFADVYTLARPASVDNFQLAPFQPMRGGEIVGAGPGAGIDHPNHALLWNAANPNGIDLHQAGWERSEANAAMHGQQGGFVGIGGISHATIWAGTAASAVDLHPAGYASSSVRFTTGTRQVGSARLNLANHAMLWSGSAASFIDLNPANQFESVARAADDLHQVGETGPFQSTQAMMWSGTAESAVNLHPGDFFDSAALGVGGNQQVGAGTRLGSGHALLWTGSAISFVDLHPAGFIASVANATNGSIQVGYGRISGDSSQHALLWSGSAASAIDLGLLHPSGWKDTVATSIGPDGTIYGTAVDSFGRTHAVTWSFVPEPASALAGLLVLLKYAASRQRRSATKSR